MTTASVKATTTTTTTVRSTATALWSLLLLHQSPRSVRSFSVASPWSQRSTAAAAFIPSRRPTSPFSSLVLLSSSSSFFSTTTAKATGPATTTTQTCSNPSNTALKMATEAAESTTPTPGGGEDPYLWLEEVESDASLTFAREANAKCLASLGDPNGTPTYERLLRVLTSDDRIPYASQYGHDAATGEAIVYNFWKDGTHLKGIWRKTTMTSYKTASPEWTTVLDLDALSEKDSVGWVWKGARPLPRSRDDGEPTQTTRTLLRLSRGGADAVVTKEFDLLTMDFVTDQPFEVSEAKSRVSYKSRDVLYVGTDTGPDSLTDSGYPRTVREWVRGTALEDAPVVFEGAKTDISVGVYLSDERIWNGGIYEVRYRSLTFYTTQHWIRKVALEHLFAPDDPRRAESPEPPEFVKVDIPDDAQMSLLGNNMFVSLRSDWAPNGENGPTYRKGSLIYTPTDDFLERGPANATFEILFAPTERTAYEYFTATKNYLIVATMDNVKSKLDFYKIGADGLTLKAVETSSSEPQIRDCSASPIDPYSGSDEFWYTTSDFLTPTTLCLADASRLEQSPPANEATTARDEEVFVVDTVKLLPPKFDAAGLVFDQQFATSKDGTQIPYFIVRRQDVTLDGKNPTLLYGYGGFEVSLGPHYVASAGLAWLERGGVYVEANIRGGGEFGPSWHLAALKSKRHKAYEDFIAVGEHLISSGLCKAPTLAIKGGSNGGLLMGNMYTMRPDLWGAIHCAVPLLDMQRYHTLLAGASWMAEYGNPDKPDEWAFLQQYSAYHNVQSDVTYPPLLMTTSTRDDRVHPGHARKFVKKMWDINPTAPVYYYENIEGGHGGAADPKQSAFMSALSYDFLFNTLTKNAESL